MKMLRKGNKGLMQGGQYSWILPAAFFSPDFFKSAVVPLVWSLDGLGFLVSERKDLYSVAGCEVLYVSK